MVLREQVRFPGDVDSLPDDGDLFQAGLTSHASINLMLALESAFDVEFPDEMLRRSTFGTIASISEAVDSLLEEGIAA